MYSPTWNERIKNAVEALEGAIPYVGFLVVALTELLWPADDVDIFDSIKSQVNRVVDAKILGAELDQRREQLDGLKDTMAEYGNAGPHEKGSLLSSMLGEVNVLHRELTESPNAVNLVPLAVVCAHIHLSLLLERLLFGSQLYAEDNSAVWKQDLTNAYNDYHGYFRQIYPRWKEWRASQIKVSLSSKYVPWIFTEVTGQVSDLVSGETVRYDSQQGLYTSETYYQDVCNAAKQRMMSQAVAGMAGTLAPTFLLHVHVPERKHEPADVDPAVGRFWMGPYSVATLGGAAWPLATDVQDAEGRVQEIRVREFNSIDALQLVYDTHAGHLVGDPNGGQAHVVKAGSDKHFTGLKMRFANGIMCGVEIAFSDDSSSGQLGNRANWDGPDAAATVDSSYELACARFSEGRGPSGTRGVGVIELEFRHTSLATVPA